METWLAVVAVGVGFSLVGGGCLLFKQYREANARMQASYDAALPHYDQMAASYPEMAAAYSRNPDAFHAAAFGQQPGVVVVQNQAAGAR
jgi:hypothetical protein